MAKVKIEPSELRATGKASVRRLELDTIGLVLSPVILLGAFAAGRQDRLGLHEAVKATGARAVLGACRE